MPTIRISRVPTDKTPVEPPDPDRTLNVRQRTGPLVPAANPTNKSSQIGGYEILEELGRGGMGVVYKAWQYGLQRTVALKMILAGYFASEAEVERFRSEATNVARLRHPHLLDIYEIGEHDGLPYYSMEYLEGGSLARRLDGKPQPPKVAARLVQVLAEAIHYAHQREVIHRDLKPANILLRGDRGAPLESCSPKITDFGLAKHLGDDEANTATGDILGTPSYMAPEQAEGRPLQIGPATDVYSLGAILYELLTGRPPFHGATPAETLALVAKVDPFPPRRLNREVPADLETITLKCIEKEPHQRYHSAAWLAEDLGRYLSGEPILARPASVVERLWKWTKRRPTQAFLYVAWSIVLIVSALWVKSSWRQAEEQAYFQMQAKYAESRARIVAEQRLAAALLDRGNFRAEQGDLRRGVHWIYRALLSAHQVEQLEGKPNPLSRVLRANLAVWGERLQQSEAPPVEITLPVAFPNEKTIAWPFEIKVSKFTANPAGTLFAAALAEDHVVDLLDAKTGQTIGQPLWHPSPVRDLVFSADGSQLATVCSKGLVRLWDVAAAQPLGPSWNARTPIDKLTFSPDGQHVYGRTMSGKVLSWASPKPMEMSLDDLNAWVIQITGFSMDDKGVMTPVR